MAGEVFTGEVIDTKNYGNVICSAYSDVESATDGLEIQFSSDGTNWYWTDEFDIQALKGKTYSIQTQARWMRILYTNGTSDQTKFDLTTILKPVYTKPSSHRVASPVSGQDDAELVKAVLSGVDEITGIFENITSFKGALNVTDGLVHKRPINMPLSRDIATGSTNPSSAITSKDRVFTVDSPTGFIVGDWIYIREGLIYEMLPLQIKVISGNDFTVNRPIDRSYTTASTVDKVAINMNVDGSVTPVAFRLTPPAGEVWQITRIIPYMLDATSMDDGKFGGMTALPNGTLLRSARNGAITTAAVWQTNGDMAGDMFDLNYSEKAPAGSYGLRGRWTFTNLAVIIELVGNDGDYAELLVEDDLTPLDVFSMKVQGRVFGY